MNRITAIKTFFEQRDGNEAFASRWPARPVSMTEMKDLSAAEREELGQLAAKAMGVELDGK